MSAESKQSDAEFFRQRGFGLRMGFGERPALLVIDMLKAFTNPQMMLDPNQDAQIAAIEPLLAAAHERGLMVLFSTVMYDDADLRDAGLWALKQKGVVTLRSETEGVQVDPRLDFRKARSTRRTRRLHDERLRARHRRRFGAERLQAHGGEVGRGRPLERCA